MKKTIVLILTVVFLIQSLCVPVYALSNSATVQQYQEENLIEKLWHLLFPPAKQDSTEIVIEQNAPVGRPPVMSEYEIYRSQVDWIQNNRLICMEQLDRLNSNYKKVDGMCNLCSMETLLNRRVAYDFSDYSNPFDDYDMFKAIGVEDLGNGKHEYAEGKSGYYLSGGVSDAQEEKYQYTSTVTYEAKLLGNKTVTSLIQDTGLTGVDAQYAAIAKLLREHPEGIWLRAEYGKHAIVITDYTESNGIIQLYAIDPVNVRDNNLGREKIEKLYFYNHNYSNGIISDYKNGAYRINIAYLVQGNGSVGTPSQSTTVPSQPTAALSQHPTTTVSSDTKVPTITISGQNYPPDMIEGSNFGLRGIISTDIGQITDLYGAIIDSFGNEAQVYGICPDKSTVDLQYTVNDSLLFGKLAPGKYSYVVRAVAENGTNRTQNTLIEHSFMVQAAVQPVVNPTVYVPPQEVYEEPAPTPYVAEVPVISISEQNVPEKLSLGQNFGIRGIVSTSCGNISRIYGAIKDSNGVVMESTYYPNQPSDNLRYSINNDLSFGKLNAGYYTYYVEATAVNEDKQVVNQLIESVFEVVGAIQSVGSTEPQMISVDYDMTVNVGKGSTLRFCSTTSVADQYEIGSIPNNATVYVYGYTVEKYEDRTWAKIQYNGIVGWVNYKWLN